MSIMETLQLALEALQHSEPKMKHYPEPVKRHSNAIAAVREFVYNGVRYFCGWDSKKNESYRPDPTLKPWERPDYEVKGWCCYKQESEVA